MFCYPIVQTTSLAKPVRMFLRCAVVLAAMLLKKNIPVSHSILIKEATFVSNERNTYKPLTKLDIRQFRMARYETFALTVRAVAFERRVDAFAFWIVG